jgi:N utilization substance protein B
MVRTELREHIFKMVFQLEFHNPEELPENLTLYFDSLENAADRDKEYIEQKYKAVVEKVVEIDEMIDAKSENWKTKRMNKVDLAILRLAVYEMKWDEDVPTGVAINEAVELAKKFSGEGAPAFVNGVLARLTE